MRWYRARRRPRSRRGCRSIDARRLIPRGGAPGWLLLALAAGLLAGYGMRGSATTVAAAQFVGGVWLDLLRATIVPLVFALVATGVARLGGAMRDGAAHLGTRLATAIGALLLLSAVVTTLMVPPLLASVALPPDAVAALRAGIVVAPPAAIPGTADALRALIPVNIVAAAGQGAIVPVVLFALALGLALGRVEERGRHALVDGLQGLGDAMIVIVGWILRAAPVGIFALAIAIGATAGLGAVTTLGRYVVVSVAVSVVLILASCLAARIVGRIALPAFLRAVGPAQAVAASTQSSIATLPSMLAAAARIGVPDRDAAVVLPLSVAVFKITAPSNALVVALALAWMAGVPVAPVQILIAIPLAILATFAVLGMPGPVSFLAATAPAAVAMGAPIDLLPILLAIDAVPDMVRTVANVTADVAVAAIVSPDQRRGSSSRVR